MAKIIPTGNLKADIESVVAELNGLSSSSGNPNMLKLAKYGIVHAHIDNSILSTQTFTSNHNLGYTPFFIAKTQTIIPDVTPYAALIDDAFYQSLHYGSGSPLKSSGAYASATEKFIVTSTQFIIEINQPSPNIASSYQYDLDFFYYLFSYPIGQKS